MTIQEVAQTIAIIGAIASLGRWILGFYFKKAREHEELKAHHKSIQERRVNDEIVGLKGAVSAFRQEINSLKMQIVEHSGQLRETGRMIDLFQKQWERTAEKLEERYRALDGAEVIKVGENSFIFKSRKG